MMRLNSYIMFGMVLIILSVGYGTLATILIPPSNGQDPVAGQKSTIPVLTANNTASENPSGTTQYISYVFIVKDTNDNPIAGITVAISAQPAGSSIQIPWQAVSDSNGRAVFTIPSDQTVIMWGVSTSGYQPTGGTTMANNPQIIVLTTSNNINGNTPSGNTPQNSSSTPNKSASNSGSFWTYPPTLMAIFGSFFIGYGTLIQRKHVK